MYKVTALNYQDKCRGHFVILKTIQDRLSPDDVPDLRLAGQPVYPGQDAAAPHTPGQHVSAAGTRDT